MQTVAEVGLKEIAKGLDHNKSLEIVGNSISKSLDHSRTIERVGSTMSKSVIIGFSVLTVGILTSSVISGLNKIQLGHMSQKYGKELKQVDKGVDLSGSIDEETRSISYYWQAFTGIYVVGLTCVGAVGMYLTK